MKQLSAWLPIAMSCTALVVVVGYVTVSGVSRESDEGAMAHIWQLLMAMQVPVVALFAATWVRREPRMALRVLALQTIVAAAAIAPVWIFKL